MKKAQEYINQHKDRFLDELFELLRIPSISADPKYKDDVLNCADFVAKSLKDAGCEKVEVCLTSYTKNRKKHDGYPIVYGEKMIDKKLPTVLIYGHYDVQPPDPLELWDSPPFEPVVKKNQRPSTRSHFRQGSLRRQRSNLYARKGFRSNGKNGQPAV